MVPPRPAPINTHITFDPSSPAFVDGVSCTACGDDMIVYGGPAADRIWKLHLPTATWTEVTCFGMIPIPRYFHAACHFNGFLLVSGGELITSTNFHHAEYLNYYELNLETFEWTCIDCFGEVPLNRSHHSFTAVKDSVVLYGGKPIPGGVIFKAVDQRALTIGSFIEFRQRGFYDLFIFEVFSRTWRRIEMFDPIAPYIWGHTANCYRSTHLIFFGGCDVGLPDQKGGAPPANVTDPPLASLSSNVHVLNLESLQWHLHAPAREIDCPAARALHVAECVNDELTVFGGFAISRSAGGVVAANDMWMWSVKKGTWRRCDFCMNQWSSKKLLSCVYGTQWIVAPTLHQVFFLEMSRMQLGWQGASCTVQKLLMNPSDLKASHEGHKPTRNTLSEAKGLSPHHMAVPRVSTDMTEQPFYLSPPRSQRIEDHSTMGKDQLLEALMKEVEYLREQVSLQHNTTEHVIAFRSPSNGAAPVESKRLYKWGTPYNTPSAADKTDELTMRVGSPSTLNRVGSVQSLREAASVVGADNSTHAAANASPPYSKAAPPSAARSVTPPQSQSIHLNVYRSSHNASPPALPDDVQLTPPFVDMQLMDHANKKKLEIFHRLHAKKHLTESLLRDLAPQSEGLSGGGADTQSRGSPGDSSDEENEDIKRIATLGQQLHRAVLNNSESKKQLLYRERKRRIQQLQDRLRALEEMSRGPDGHDGERSPETKATLNFVLQQSEMLREVVEAQEIGAPMEKEKLDDGSEVSSMVVAVPPTHDPPSSLRSSSFGSISSVNTANRVDIAGGVAKNNESVAPLGPPIVEVSDAIQRMESLQRRFDENPPILRVLEHVNHEVAQLSQSGPPAGPVGFDEKDGMISPETSAAPSTHEDDANGFQPMRDPLIFAGFQRKRAQSSVKQQRPEGVAEGGPTRTLRLLHQEVLPGALGDLPPAPPLIAAHDSLQSQWDVLQTALTARGSRNKK